MKIWLVQTGEMLPLTKSDRRMRTGHLAFELASRGHQVIWWSSAFDHMSKRWIDRKDKDLRINDNLKIKLIKSIGYNSNVSLRRYLDHWYLAFKFKQQIKKEPNPDIIISALPDHHLAYEAARYAVKNNIPHILDLRDLWPDLFVDLIKQRFIKSVLRLLLVRDFLKTRYILNHANSLVSMMKRYLQLGSERGRRAKNPHDKVFYLGAEKAKINNKNNIRKNVSSIISSVKGKFVVLYIGTFNRICYPLTLMHAAKVLSKINTKQEIVIILAGDGDYIEQLKANSKDCSNIKFTGWVNNDEIAALLNIASVGIVTANEPFIAFPNKFFTYLSGGLPIINAFEGEVKELIESECIGYSYQYNNQEELSEKILSLEKSEEIRKNMSSNSLKVFNSLFDSNKIYSDYADHIEKVAARSDRQNRTEPPSIS